MTGIRLTAPAPGWAIDADVVVVGSGVAGLTTALRCAAAGLATVVVTKARLDDGSTRWAQGGIAAALGEGTPRAAPRRHPGGRGGPLRRDGGARPGHRGPRRRTPADRDRRPLRHHRHRRDRPDPRGRPPPPPHRARGGDATGAEISRALVEAVRSAALHTIENALVLDLLTDAEGRTQGVTLHVMGEGQHDGVGAVRAPAVVLATGGMGQVFSATTNPPVSTGDGVALALRAGAEVSDLEFVQFHPTVLFLGADSEGQQPLVSEAVRGEGAHLVDASGTRFMLGQHELAELAPRDIVAKAITRQMLLHGTEHMYLDARHFGAEMWEQRFPTILAACRAHGIDPVTEPIPVAPAAHYASGGVRTDLRGRTTVPGLYACGEVACTGVHGANRLASNSLLEGLVFAERIAADIVDGPRTGAGAAARTPVAEPAGTRTVPLLTAESRTAVQRIMTKGAGVIRSGGSLAVAAGELDALQRAAAAADKDGPKDAVPGVEAWEATNLLLVSQVLVAAARQREETRGCHWREDRPERDDDVWRRHLVVRVDPYLRPVVRTTDSSLFPPVRTGDPADSALPAGLPNHPADAPEEP